MVVVDGGEAMTYLTEPGVNVLRTIFRGALYVLSSKRTAAYEKGWIRTASRLRLVSHGFKETVSWYESVDAVTHRLRAFNVGRQRKLGEFSVRASVVITRLGRGRGGVISRISMDSTLPQWIRW